ncbi:MAG: ribosome silencing factor [Chitinophagaceae bacterium]|nr:MAG: ribosome silencing factor [Chitinophagaceae bacterium]
MEKAVAAPLSKKKIKTTSLSKRSKIIKVITDAILDKKGENIISLDLRKINEAVADFFIVCEASSHPQVRAIAEHIKTETIKHCKEEPHHFEGRQSLNWVLIDYINVVIHIMLPDTRKFYKLEEMWGDAAKEEYIDK